MLYLITCTDVADGPAIRDRVLATHLDHIAAVLPEKRIRIAGPVNGPNGKPHGSYFIVEAESEADARAFLARDPFHKAGLWATIKVEPCRAVAGDWVGGRTW